MENLSGKGVNLGSAMIPNEAYPSNQETSSPASALTFDTVTIDHSRIIDVSIGPLLGSSAGLGTNRPQAFETFLSSTNPYTEDRYPGSKMLLTAILEQGLAHVVGGSKPAYLAYKSLRSDQGDLAGVLGLMAGGRRLNPKFAVVNYSAEKLCTGVSACFVINKHAMLQTIASNATALGIETDEKSAENLLKIILGGGAEIFKNEVALGIPLELGEINSRHYVARKHELKQYESLDDAGYNEKLSEIDSCLGLSTIRHSVGATIANMDISMPRPWLGSVWDSKETALIAVVSIKESQGIDSDVRLLHARRNKDASCVDTLIEYVVEKLYIRHTPVFRTGI
ncbi:MULTISPECIES: hypothetical protein [Pseudomonas]|uniref:Uncharacterized protein n=1 Tax=Pseudomonas wuhanensis TaxID=2954098 RepID=A0ABY9GLA5_9PSED|nr:MULTISPECIES: hypothetical protein [unclassified Pseudomonas]WLI10725.1 hypothetical protein PSH65_21160 [Pseudomonas sp. FP603]WLI16542.1 hypothetical protein PSH88_19785 [Pseudomonas sp. FP607]